MSYENIEFSTEDKLAIIRLNRPDRLNALNPTITKELLDALKEVERNNEIGGLLLTGNGKGFCAGADITEVNFEKVPEKMAAQGESGYNTLVNYFNPIIALLNDMPKPVIAAVNGVAAGYGVSLALACDIALTAESASFIQVFTPQLGIVPDGGSTWFMPRTLTRARTKGMFLTGAKVKGKQAEEWGMIWKSVADETLYEEAKALAYKLAHGPTEGIAAVKKALNESPTNNLKDQLQLEAELQRECIATEDFIEGVLAFAEKRKPTFSGK